MRKRRKAVKSVRSAFAMSPLKKQKNKSRLRKGRSGIGSMRFEEFVMKRGKNWPGFGKVGHPSGAGSLGFEEFVATRGSTRYAQYREGLKEKRKRKVGAVLAHRKAKHQRKKRARWLRTQRTAGKTRSQVRGKGPKLEPLSIHDVEGHNLPHGHYRTPGKGPGPSGEPLSRSQIRRGKSKRRRADRDKPKRESRGDPLVLQRPEEHHGDLSIEERKQMWAKSRRPGRGGFKASPVRRALWRKGRKEAEATRTQSIGPGPFPHTKAAMIHARISERGRAVAAEKKRLHDLSVGNPAFRSSQQPGFPGVHRTRHWPYSDSNQARSAGGADQGMHVENKVELTQKKNHNHLQAMWQHHLLTADGHSHDHIVRAITDQPRGYPMHREGTAGEAHAANNKLPRVSEFGHGQAHKFEADQPMNVPSIATEPHHREGKVRQAPKYLPFDTVVKNLQKRKPLPGTGNFHKHQRGVGAEPYTGHMDEHDWKLHSGQIFHEDHPRHEDGPSNRPGSGVNSPGGTWSHHGNDEKLRWKEVHGPGPRIDRENGDDTPDGLNSRWGTQGHHAYPEHLYGRPSGGSVLPRKLTTREAIKEKRETYGSQLLDPNHSRYNPDRHGRWKARGDTRLHENPHSHDGGHYSWYDHADEDHPSMTAHEIHDLTVKTGDHGLVHRKPDGTLQQNRDLSDDERDRLHKNSLFRVPAVRPADSLRHDVAERMKAHAVKGHLRVFDENKPMTYEEGEQKKSGVGINNSYLVGGQQALPLPQHVEYVGNSNQVVDFRGRTREEVQKERKTQEDLRKGDLTASWWTSSYPQMVPIDHPHHPGGFSESEYDQMIERARLLRTPFKRTQPPRNPRHYSKTGQTVGMGELRRPHDEAAEQAVAHIKHPGERQKALTREIYNRTPDNMLTRRERIHKRTLDALETGRASPAAIKKYRAGGINHTKEMAGVPPRRGQYQVIRLKHDGGDYEDGVYPDGYYNVHINPSPEKFEELKQRYMEKHHHYFKHVRGHSDAAIADRFNYRNLGRGFHMGKHGFAFRDEMREMGHLQTKRHMRDQLPLGPGNSNGTPKERALQAFYNAFANAEHAHTAFPPSFDLPNGDTFHVDPQKIAQDRMPSQRGVGSQQRRGKRGKTAAVKRWTESSLNPEGRREEAMEKNREIYEQQKRREARDLRRWEAHHDTREYNLRKRYVDHPDYPGDEYEREWSDTDPVTGRKFPARGQGPMGAPSMTYHRGPRPAADPEHERYAQASYVDVPDVPATLPSDPKARQRYIISRSPAMRPPPDTGEVRSRSTSEPWEKDEYEREAEGIRGSRDKPYEATKDMPASLVHARRVAAQGESPFPHMSSEFRSQNPYLFGEGIVAHFSRYSDNGDVPPEPDKKEKPGRDDREDDYKLPNPWSKPGKRLPTKDEHGDRIRKLEKLISAKSSSKRAVRAGITYPLLSLGRMLHKPPAGEDQPPTGFHEFRSKRDYKKNKRNTNKTPHSTKGRRGRRPPRRPGLKARKQFADWHDWFPDEKTTQREWKSWYPDDKGSPPSGNFFEFMAKSRRHQKNVRKQAAGEEGMTHTGKHLGGAGGKQKKKAKVDETLTGGPKTTMGKGGVVRRLTSGELQGQRAAAKKQTRSSLSKRRKKEILDELRAQGKLHEFGIPAVAMGVAAAAPHIAKAGKWAWKHGKKLVGGAAKVGVAAGAGALAGRGRGPKKRRGGTDPSSLVRKSTRSQEDVTSGSPRGASKARAAGLREERGQGKLRGLGRLVRKSFLNQRGAGKREVEDR